MDNTVTPALMTAMLGALSDWKSAVIDKLVIAHIYTNEHETDPEKAINDLISYHVGLTLNPAVSDPMAQLYAVVSSARTLFNQSEECHFDDDLIGLHGLGRGAINEYWGALDEALSAWSETPDEKDDPC